MTNVRNDWAAFDMLLHWYCRELMKSKDTIQIQIQVLLIKIMNARNPKMPKEQVFVLSFEDH